MQAGEAIFAHPAHAEVWDLLPWYGNGGLEIATRRRVEQHLGECLMCTREVKRLRQLSVAVAAPADEYAASQGLARLSARMRAPRQSSRPRWLDILRGLVAPVPAMVAALVVVCAVLVTDFERAMLAGAPHSDRTFQTLGQQRGTRDALGAPELRVVLRDAAGHTLRDAWLARHDVRLVEGPSEIGVLTVAVTPGRRSLGDMVAAMRADPDTLFVEPLSRLSARPDRRR